MTRTAQPTRPAPECPSWCTKHHIGAHTQKIGLSEFGDEVTVRLAPGSTSPVVYVTRTDGRDVQGLSFTQARALADLLVDNECMDRRLAVLLREAADLATPPELRPHPVAVLLLRLFGRKVA